MGYHVVASKFDLRECGVGALKTAAIVQQVARLLLRPAMPWHRLVAKDGVLKSCE
jgi:hypothetical protein